MEKFIPLFGLLTAAQQKTLSRLFSEKWGSKPTSLGAMASPKVYEMLPFREEISIPFLVLDAKVINVPHMLPNYDNIRNARKDIKVVVCVTDDNEIPIVSSGTNKPDFFINLTNEKVITT